MPTLTLNEKFEAWFRANVDRGADAVDRQQAFLAGAQAQTEINKEAAIELRRMGYCNQCGKRIVTRPALNESADDERRIKERDNA